MHKSIIYLSAIITLLTLKSGMAQTYYFMNDSAEWKVNYSYIPGYDCFQCQYKYYISGDTIINSIHYKKLRRSTLEQLTDFTDEYEGAIRQDTIAKKVFFYADFFSAEEVLYDYSPGVGDTIDVWLGNNWVIFSVDSVLIGNQYHKRMNYGFGFYPADTLYLIEGVGSFNGLLQSLSDNTFESYAFLTCFSVSGNLLYTANQQFLDNEGCDVSVPLHNPSNYDWNQIRIFPNPAHDKVQVVSNHPIEDITIRNLYATDVIIYSSVSSEINISNLSAGCYFMKIRTVNNISTQMLIVQ